MIVQLALLILGALLVVAGVAVVNPAAALIVAGVAVGSFALLWDFGGSP